MAKRRSNSQCLVTFSARADADFSGIHANTAAVWGYQQAERYADFLEDTIVDLVDGLYKGRPVLGGHPDARTYFVKWHKARHGHHIVYRPSKEGGIHIIRILHGRMNLPNHIEEE